MKKMISFVLAATLSLAMFTGCSEKSPDNGTDTPKVTITSAADLDGLKIGCQSGTTGEAWVTDNCLKKAPTGYKTGMEAAMDLKNGKIDAVVLDELPAKSIVAKNDDLMILEIKVADPEEYAIAIKKGNTELKDAINATIKKMKEDGKYEELVNAFMPADGKIVIPDALATSGSKTLKMGTNAAFAPFEYVEGDKIVGFDVSMSQQVAADMGAKLEVVDMEFGSLIAAVQSGNIDLAAAGMSVNEERLKSVDFSDTYYSSQQVIIVKK